MAPIPACRPGPPRGRVVSEIAATVLAIPSGLVETIVKHDAAPDLRMMSDGPLAIVRTAATMVTGKGQR